MRLKTFLTTALVALMLVIGIDYVSWSATGRSLVLGKANYASTPTSISRGTQGATLQLYSKAGFPPLRVNRTVKAPNLNADLVDGKHASQLGVRTRVYEKQLKTTGSVWNVAVPSVTKGEYLVTYSGWVYGPPGTVSWCYIDRKDDNTTKNAPATAPSGADVNDKGFQLLNGSGYLRLTSTSTVRLHCEYDGAGEFTSFGGMPIQITLTRVDARSGHTPKVPQRLAPTR